LRTPIAIVRGEADVTLQRTQRDEQEYRESLGVIRDETTRLTRIVNDLFLLASADAGAPLDQHEALDVSELVLGALRSVRSIADERQVQLVSADVVLPGPVVFGDSTLLRRLVLNLLDNALKHAPSGGRVEIESRADANQAVVVVRDDGPGITPALRDRVFDRFVRGMVNRNASPDSAVSSGAGLGLAMAEAIATMHRGRLSLDETSLGASFRLILPLASDAV
jgi:signal transduction histidine kinase